MAEKMKRLLLFPTLKEAKPLIEKMGLKATKFADLYKGEDFDVAIVGAGKVQSAINSYNIIKTGDYAKIVLCGIGGAYPGRGIKMGDVVLATKEIYADEGVGYSRLKERHTHLFPTEFEMETQDLPELTRGVFLTLSLLPAGPFEARRIAENFPEAICENMEGAAVAHAAFLLKRKISEIRAISNFAGERNKKKWDVEKAIKNLTDTLIAWIER